MEGNGTFQFFPILSVILRGSKKSTLFANNNLIAQRSQDKHWKTNIIIITIITITIVPRFSRVTLIHIIVSSALI